MQKAAPRHPLCCAVLQQRRLTFASLKSAKIVYASALLSADRPVDARHTFHSQQTEAPPATTATASQHQAIEHSSAATQTEQQLQPQQIMGA